MSPIVNGVPDTLVTGIPSLPPPTLSPSSPSVALGSLGTPAGTLGATTLPLNYRRGYYESYNVAIERELPGAMTLNAAYVGELIIREVPGININANQAPGQTVAQEPMNALYGISAGITSEIPNGTGHYNGLQAQAKRRFAGDSSVGVNYTYSRAMNDYGDQSDGVVFVHSMAAPYWRLNRAVAGFDRTHNLQIFGNYMLPIGKGQGFLPGGVAGYILGGWSLSGSLSRESGTPFTVTGSGGSLGPSTPAARNLLTLSPSRTDSWRPRQHPSLLQSCRFRRPVCGPKGCVGVELLCRQYRSVPLRNGGATLASRTGTHQPEHQRGSDLHNLGAI